MNIRSIPETVAPAIRVNGIRLVPDPCGCLLWPDEGLMIVADLHLEKGSAFATRGQLLPPYDSAATIASLIRQVEYHKPARLIFLGDTFHDLRAHGRMDQTVQARLSALAASVDCIWLSGNHDPQTPADLPGSRCAEMIIGPLVFRHEPQAGAQSGEIAGHLHPVARVVTPRGRMRRRAFVSDGNRLVMPAFGAYAGGLNLRDPAIDGLFSAGDFRVHVCGTSRVYPIPQNRLFAD